MGEPLSQLGSGLEAGPSSPLQRKQALFALLVVTSVWGATFIWMKQALNALEPEIQDLGRFQVVAILVAARFAVAAIAMLLFFPKARAALFHAEQWRGGLILGGIMLVGFVTQMIGLEDLALGNFSSLLACHHTSPKLCDAKFSSFPSCVFLNITCTA